MFQTLRVLSLAASVSALAVAMPAIAQTSGDMAVPHRDTPHDDNPERTVIVISAGGIERLDLLAGATVVSAEELLRNDSGQIGEVLAKLPGVSATGFAPGASRPVLRGFQGERVRVLVDGVGSIDASNTSADHAVSIDPLTADGIEVLRGPAVLLYGSSAIGGAVNVIDRRIPHYRPENGMRFDGIVSGDTASDLRQVGASLDLAVGDNLAWHVDGSYRETDDFEIAGFALSEDLRADLLGDAALEEDEGEFEEADELREAANQRGILPGSATETLSLGTGVTFFGNQSNIGFSIGYYDTLYGVPTLPGAHHHEEGEGVEGEEGEEEGEEAVSIDLEQLRLDMRGEFHLGDGFFHDLITRWGYSDYTHTELEGAEVGTIFNVEGVEGRIELIQNERGSGDNTWQGSIGGQFYQRDFEAIGAEAFVPPNDTRQFALFTLQEVRRGPVEVELAARYENTQQRNFLTADERDFDAFSGAAGLSYSWPSGVRAGVNFSRAERAPATEELFADGPHIATQQFEIGDPDLVTESAWGVEGYVRASLGGSDLRIAVYRNWFDDYIDLVETGDVEDDLPVFAFQQQDADWFGVEAEAIVPITSVAGGTLSTDLRGSYIRATLADGSPVARIPPLTLLGALDWESDRLDLRGEVEWFDEQDRTAAFESATDDFTLVNLSLAYRPFGDRRLTLLAQANNVFDAQGRRHASFTKEFVPLTGRNFKLTVRTRL